MTTRLPLLLAATLFAAVAPASCGGTVDADSPAGAAGGADGGDESINPPKGGSAGMPANGGAGPGGAAPCPVDEPYRGDLCSQTPAGPCVYSRPHCEYSAWVCNAGQWAFPGAAGSVAFSCPGFDVIPPEGERCDCNGHRWQEDGSQVPCFFPGGCARCIDNHWHHESCWYDAGPVPADAAPEASVYYDASPESSVYYDAGPEASVYYDAGPEASMPPDAGFCGVLGTWKISDVNSSVEAVVTIHPGDAGAPTPWFEGVSAHQNECGGGTGDLNYSFDLNPSTCVMEVGWFKSWMNGSCFEGDCESMSYKLLVQGTNAIGNRTFLHETCGHGDGVDQVFPVTAVKLP